MFDLTGKRALVTGASGGIGRAIALALHRQGAIVALSGTRREALEAVAMELGTNAHVLPCDLSKAEDVETLVPRAVEAIGDLDILVNSAGIIRDRTMKKMEPDDWSVVLDTNLTGVFNVCKAASAQLADGGRIVNISSISGFLGFFGQANYAASKAGVAALSRVLSRELAKRAITVNAVAPGVVLTEMGLSIPESVRTEMLRSIPLARFGESGEIADVVLFLCSGLASYMTGQVLHVNGGWL